MANEFRPNSYVATSIDAFGHSLERASNFRVRFRATSMRNADASHLSFPRGFDALARVINTQFCERGNTPRIMLSSFPVDVKANDDARPLKQRRNRKTARSASRTCAQRFPRRKKHGGKHGFARLPPPPAPKASQPRAR